MRPLRLTKLLVATGLAVVCVIGSEERASAGPATVLAVHKGHIDEPVGALPQFGVNGTRLRWHDLTPDTSGRPWTLDVEASTTSVTSRWPAGLAFSAGRVASRYESGGNVRYNSLGVSKDRRAVRLEEFQTPDEGAGGYIADPYALGPYIAYGWYETGSALRGSCDSDGFSCDYRVRRGGLRLIQGLRRGRLVADAPVAAFTLSNTGAVAYVRATDRWHNHWGPSVIEVITLWSPQVLQRITAPGKVMNLAVTDRVLAVKTYMGASNRPAVLLYDLWSGNLLRTLRLEAYSLALRGSTAVLFQGRNVVELEAYSGAKRILARTRGYVGGLAFAGNRLVWYENLDGPDTYRIMSLSPRG